MSSVGAHTQQTTFTRQATILRKNLLEWDHVLHHPRGEDWTTMLGRLNAAYHQTTTLNDSIDDVMAHFVYLPKQPTANPGDIPFFLSTKLDPLLDETTTPHDPALPDDDEDEKREEEEQDTEETTNKTNKRKRTTTMSVPDLVHTLGVDPVRFLAHYEEQAATVVHDYEEAMLRF